MKERLLAFLRAENKTAAQFADEIDVQPSGISHILSGRNNPSLDFVMKMLETYDYISTEWLLFGKGNMYKDESVQQIADESENLEKRTETSYQPEDDKDREQKLQADTTSPVEIKHKAGIRKVERIVWFYTDNSFEEYFPEKD